MTYTQLEYVLAVNKFRHFQRAANACNVTQPTLSMQIGKLEDELDIIIFDRSKSPLLPTKIGEEVIAQAKIAIIETRKIQDIIKQKKDLVEGEFRLAIIPTLSPYLIPLFIEQFIDKYPKVKISIEERSTREVLNLLAGDEIDAGIISTPTQISSLIERHLFYEPFYLFVSEKHKLFKKNQVTEGDLNIDDIWLLKEGHCFRNQALKICSMTRTQNDHSKSNVNFESGNMETLKNLVLKGSGYTMLPFMATKDLRKEHKKMIKEFKCPMPTREISLVHSRSFLKENIIKALEDTIIENLPNDVRSLKSSSIEVLTPCPAENK